MSEGSALLLPPMDILISKLWVVKVGTQKVEYKNLRQAPCIYPKFTGLSNLPNIIVIKW